MVLELSSVCRLSESGTDDTFVVLWICLGLGYRGCVRGWVRNAYHPHRGVYVFMSSQGIQFRSSVAREKRAHPEYSHSERLDFRAIDYRVERKVHKAAA